MAQFDVHTNPGRNRAVIPYVVNVQSHRLEGAGTRIVVPLVRSSDSRNADPRLIPSFQVLAETLFLNPLALFTTPLSALGPVVASLAADPDAGRIIAAIDEVISQAYG
jgi:toxin CcdB